VRYVWLIAFLLALYFMSIVVTSIAMQTNKDHGIMVASLAVFGMLVAMQKDTLKEVLEIK